MSSSTRGQRAIKWPGSLQYEQFESRGGAGYEGNGVVDETVGAGPKRAAFCATRSLRISPRMAEFGSASDLTVAGDEAAGGAVL
ncbi:unnamed protein product [Mycena citricolor]|uniref:Uncharacterized protein n=1 Tax=Mycena citricolor TaxID=2018698 RepID=A0AAD2K0S0_9AGAR|nr:unnamed protein product [Mycena citricolor]